MRDYALFGIAAVGLLLTLWRPWTGMLLYLWFAYMNPQRLCFAAAYGFPFSAIIVAVLVPRLIFSRESKRLPLKLEAIVLIVFASWLTLNTFFALDQEAAWPQWGQAIKILFMVVILLIMCGHKERLNSAIWTMVLSLGFYGVRGAFGTVLHGGMYRIYGPDRTFIADNNDLALALVTVIPLTVYLLMCSRRRLVRMGLSGLIICFAVAVVGTYSRAGLLALVATGLALLWKTPYRIRAIFGLCVCGCLLYAIAPAQWFSRMGTISEYSEDQSALGRINSWRFALNLVADRPLTGGGFEAFSPELFQRYAPDPENYHAAHSIYFKVLGEQGIVGLALFLLLWGATWKSAGEVRRWASLNEETAWAGHLTSMVQVAFIAYGVGGAFGNLCYFDLPYHLMALVIGTKVVLSASMADHKGEEGFSADISNMVQPCEAPQ